MFRFVGLLVAKLGSLAMPIVGALAMPIAFPGSAWAESPIDARFSDSRFLPDSTVFYVEMPDPKRVLSLVFDHPLREKIESLEPYRVAQNSPQYRAFMLGRTMVEAQVQMSWRDALETLLSRGAVFGFDLDSKGFALILRGKDSDSMQLFRDKLIEFAKLGTDPDRIKEGEYRGIKAHQVGQFAFAVYEDRLMVTNQKDLGKEILDQFFDGGVSLAEQPQFRSALENRSDDVFAWAYLDLHAIRDAGVADSVFHDQINQPVAELILGGIQSSLRETPYANASLAGSPSKLDLTISMPHQADWLPESREYYFGSGGHGRAPQVPELPQTLFSLGIYRDFSQMWLRGGDLFNADTNDGLAKADATLTTLFAGRDFGEDILGSFQPEVGFVAVRQDFAHSMPKPAIKLPAFAAIFELREAKTMTRELRRIFQSLVGFLNVVGAMEGRPQLELNMESVGETGQLVSATYVPEDDEVDSENAKIVFNFSPSIGFSGNRCVLASSRSLAKDLTERSDLEGEKHDLNTRASLNADVLRDVLADNRQQLVAQNMLEEGHTREEAERDTDLLLQVIQYLRGATASLGTENDSLNLALSIELDP